MEPNWGLIRVLELLRDVLEVLEAQFRDMIKGVKGYETT
jgi:hypothetical protein